jgi:tetratricopeptide (TPR) repeat protein
MDLKLGLGLAGVVLALAVGFVFLQGSGFFDNAVRPPGDMQPPLASDNMHPDLLAGVNALHADDLELALEHLGRVPVDDPGYALALQNLGATQMRVGELEAAVETLSELVRVQPENATAHDVLGWAYYEWGRLDDAELCALRAVEVDAHHLPARYNVALYRVAGNDPAAAIHAYHRALRLDAQATHVSMSIDALTRLHETRPELPAVHYALAFLHKTLGRRALEEQELEHFLALESAGPVADVARARLDEARQAAKP